jgi:hypothetical protein
MPRTRPGGSSRSSIHSRFSSSARVCYSTVVGAYERVGSFPLHGRALSYRSRCMLLRTRGGRLGRFRLVGARHRSDVVRRAGSRCFRLHARAVRDLSSFPRRHHPFAKHLTNRWSQPLAAVKYTFDFTKQFSMFATLAFASGGSAPSR